MNLATKPRWSTLLQLFWLSYPIPFCLLSPILNSFHQVPSQVKLVAKRKHNPILGENRFGRFHRLESGCADFGSQDFDCLDQSICESV